MLGKNIGIWGMLTLVMGCGVQDDFNGEGEKASQSKTVTESLGCDFILEEVTYGQFEQFVLDTEYKTDAEKYGWSIVQQDVFSFEVVNGANWITPNGVDFVLDDKLPVTQVSYNDAIAYCEWSGTSLPTYEEYWKYAEDHRIEKSIISNNLGPISNADSVNLIGNVWEITQPEGVYHNDSIRLAGGSIFCAKETCHGTSPDRKLYIDSETGNVNIGFAVKKNL